VTEHSAPVYMRLLDGGPHRVWQEMVDGFEPDPRGYISRCHLCLTLRQHLRRNASYEELRPDDFYS
jgi:hypothetical protein